MSCGGLDLLRDRIQKGKAVRILSVDGGGYLGLATAAFIKGIESHFGVTFHSTFDLFCGTSTGAIISLALAYGKTGAELTSLYEQLGLKVFKRSGSGIFSPKYRNIVLRSVLTEEFGAATLGDVLLKGKTALVTAFNVTTGTPRIFKTDHSANLTRDSKLELVDVAMASAAAPIFFPLVQVRNPLDGIAEIFCDGGVVANQPALLGFAEALAELRAKPEQIRVLSISTPRIDLGEGAASKRTLNRGLLGWRRTLPGILIDSNSMAAHQIFRRIADSYDVQHRPLYERIEMPNKQRLPMDAVTEESTATLKHLGLTEAASNVVRGRIRPILLEEEES